LTPSTSSKANRRLGKGRKQFFFEKRTKKLFHYGYAETDLPGILPTMGEKFFGSFFQKRTASFL
jgi:hypothetical protein